MDLVGTCPKDFWDEWLAEGDAAGEPETGTEWGWYTGDRKAKLMKPGDRFYVVAHGRLRGYATVVRIDCFPEGFAIIRKGGAVACTIPQQIPGFRGLRYRWWNPEAELPFPGWREP
jgi:hypothetical protein